MAKPKVLATHSLFDAARKILQKSCEVEFWTKPERPPREEVLRRVKDKDGLVCLLTEKVNEELLQAAPKLRIAANVAVGFDNIDVAACTKRGVAATNTPGVFVAATPRFVHAATSILSNPTATFAAIRSFGAARSNSSFTFSVSKQTSPSLSFTRRNTSSLGGRSGFVQNSTSQLFWRIFLAASNKLCVASTFGLAISLASQFLKNYTNTPSYSR